MAAPGLAIELLGLADRIARMRAIGRNGDATPFYEDRSQAVRDARSLAQLVRSGMLPPDYVPSAERDGPEIRPSYAERRR